jgi:biotin carboxyl carrier protein
MKTELTVRIGEKDFRVDLGPDGTVAVDGKAHEVEVLKAGTSVMTVTIDGVVLQGSSKLIGDDGDGSSAASRMVISAGGRDFEVEVDDERSRLIKSFHPKTGASGGPTRVKAPMPGLVVRLEVAVGQEVKPGQGLLVLEAMKMENEIRCLVEGVIEKIDVKPGEAVEKDEVLMVIRPPEST